MSRRFEARWHDPAKVEKAARAAGWKKGEGSILDHYHPDEYSDHEQEAFRELDDAVVHLRNVIAEGRDFFGEGRVLEYEQAAERCRGCSCGGWWLVREHAVDGDGIADAFGRDGGCPRM